MGIGMPFCYNEHKFHIMLKTHFVPFWGTVFVFGLTLVYYLKLLSSSVGYGSFIQYFLLAQHPCADPQTFYNAKEKENY